MLAQLPARRRSAVALIVAVLGLGTCAALAASMPPPLAAVNSYWADVAAGRYSAAYGLIAPGAIDLTSAQFVTNEKAARVVQIQFSGVVSNSTASTATVNVLSLRTIDLEFGCRKWTGSYAMTERAGRWLIERSDITPQPCVGPTKLPVLAGPWGAYQEGYGYVEPKSIFNGGDPTGLVTGIHWETWGGARATGTGEGWYVGPHEDVAHGKKAPAKIVLFHLGTCHGRAAYDAIEWFFPGQKQVGAFVPGDYIDPCTGVYYMDGKAETP